MADGGNWNISALACDASGLKGNRANCWQLTGRDGEGPIIGEFRVRFRESEWTAWLAHDATAGERPSLGVKNRKVVFSRGRSSRGHTN